MQTFLIRLPLLLIGVGVGTGAPTGVPIAVPIHVLVDIDIMIDIYIHVAVTPIAIVSQHSPPSHTYAKADQ